MKKLIDSSKEFLLKQKFDAISVGVIDFEKHEFQTLELYKNESNLIVEQPFIYYDLASLTKPLTNGISFLDHRGEINSEMELVLNHRGGLPAWGLLPRIGWKEIIFAYDIKASETLYSDYSALRFMLEFEKNVGIDLYSVAQKYWHNEILHWQDMTQKHFCLQNGFRDGKPNLGIVHDPNAFNIKGTLSHAGLFGTITGVCETLIKVNKKLNLLSTMLKDVPQNRDHRFVNGWDRATDLENTLAGKGCSECTFGHLGFTGTSIWIDPVKKLGHVILTNATKLYWYDKSDLNAFRREIGEKIWLKNY